MSLYPTGIEPGGTLVKKYWQIPAWYGYSADGMRYDSMLDAAEAAIKNWATTRTEFPISAPVIDERWEYKDALGLTQDVPVQRHELWPYDMKGIFGVDRPRVADRLLGQIAALRALEDTAAPQPAGITDALRGVDVDPAIIVALPTGEVTVTTTDGSRYAIGPDGEGWWTGTSYTADDEIVGTESWTNLTTMAEDVAAWVKQR